MNTKMMILSFLALTFFMGIYAGSERKISFDEYKDKMKAGWIGQMVGVAWPAPTEFKFRGSIIPINEKTALPDLIEPLAENTVNKSFWQDDLYAETIFLETLEKYGLGISHRQAGIDFANSKQSVYCANAKDRSNTRVGIASLAFAPVFNNGAVLQCEMPVNVWGSAVPGSKVTIKLDELDVATATADNTGVWQAVLPAQKPGGLHVLGVVSGEQGVFLQDIRLGEVWIASGQSNMEFGLGGAEGSAAFLKKDHSKIRFAVVPKKRGALSENPYTAEELRWRGFSSKISAVAGFFADKIQRDTGREVGILQSAWGGTRCEAWTPRHYLEAVPELESLVADWLKLVDKTEKSQEEYDAEIATYDTYMEETWRRQRNGELPQTSLAPPNPEANNPYQKNAPGILYEHMMRPIIRYTARGVIWYQGESNAGKYEQYRTLFPTMIHSWRTEAACPDWPFLFVQLPGYKDEHFPGLRAAQTLTRDTVPHTAMACAIDYGEKENIHPKDKQPVGERLAFAALRMVYGKPVADRGPYPARIRRSDGGLVVEYDFAKEGLEANGSELPGFEVAGADGQFHAATARVLLGNRVAVKCEAVAAPETVRYAYVPWPDPALALYNHAGLPAEPFKKKIYEK
jgi:sialate O-acetylesterase